MNENSKLKPGENMLGTEIVSDIQNNFCIQHVLQKEEAFDKDLPVPSSQNAFVETGPI